MPSVMVSGRILSRDKFKEGYWFFQRIDKCITYGEKGSRRETD
ncbi:S protein [Salmonella phage 19]|nr:S protein [Salmonella phage 19]